MIYDKDNIFRIYMLSGAINIYINKEFKKIQYN
jgi:hypothetical protein